MGIKGWVVGAGLLLAEAALGNPRPLPFTYQVDQLPKGGAEVEQFVEGTPVPIHPPDATSADARGAELRLGMVTELEYGLSDHLELGLYLAGGQDAGGPFVLDGIKQRLRFRFAQPGEWPVDVGLYGEVAELHDELELEGKLLLQRRIGGLLLAANLVAERELGYTGGGQWILQPSAGLSYELRPSVQLGLEYWLHAEPPEGETPAEGSDLFNAAVHHFLGPTVLWQIDKLWWSTGVYGRLDDLARRPEVGDQLGKLWVRTIVGISL